MSSKRRLLSACGATLLASGLLSQSAQADLLIDLRTPTGTKAADLTAGANINLDVYARITLTTNNAETNAAFQEIQGNFLSSPGVQNLLGTIAPAGGTCCGLTPVTVVGTSPFNDSGSVPGTQTDLDGDTDLDLGHANSDTAAGFNYIRDDRMNKAASQGAGYVGVVIDPNTVEWKIGRISFAASGGAAQGQSTNVNFAFRRIAAGTLSESAALWFEPAQKTALTGVLSVGAPVVLTINAPVNPQWNVDADGNWSLAGNWSGGVPNSNTAVANFLGKITAAHTVTLDGSRQVLEVHFDNANKYTIAPGSGTLTIGNGTTGTVEVVQGTHEISAPLAFSGAINKTGSGTLRISGAQSHAVGSSLNVSVGNVTLASDAGTAAGALAASANLSLNVSGTGAKLTLASSQNLKNLTINTAAAGTQGVDLSSTGGPGTFNGLHVYATDLDAAKASLWAAIKNAVANPLDGLYDSAQASHTNARIGIAKSADAHGDQNVFVRLARVGDLNLDGQVSIADFIDLAGHFNQSGPTITWQEGDLNYDGQVSIGDFIDLAGNFNSNYAGETWAISDADQHLLSSFAASVGVAVPEPGTMGLVLLGAFGLLGRRRRSR